MLIKDSSGNLFVLIFKVLTDFTVILSNTEKGMLNLPLQLFTYSLVFTSDLLWGYAIRWVQTGNNHVFLVKFYQYDMSLLSNTFFSKTYYMY